MPLRGRLLSDFLIGVCRRLHEADGSAAPIKRERIQKKNAYGEETAHSKEAEQVQTPVRLFGYG